MIRYIKMICVGSVALLFTLLAWNNLRDFETNRLFIESITNMNGVKSPHVIWRSVTNQQLQLVLYWSIILWELMTASICWVGAFLLGADGKYGRRYGMVGLTMGFTLFMVGFVVIGSEWFYMWQTATDLQLKSIAFSILMISILTFVRSEDS